MKQSSGPGSGAQVEERLIEKARQAHPRPTHLRQCEIERECCCGTDEEVEKLALWLADFERDVRADAMEQAARLVETMAAEPERRRNFVAYGVMATLMLTRDLAAALRRGGAEPPQGEE